MRFMAWAKAATYPEADQMAPTNPKAKARPAPGALASRSIGSRTASTTLGSVNPRRISTIVAVVASACPNSPSTDDQGKQPREQRQHAVVGQGRSECRALVPGELVDGSPDHELPRRPGDLGRTVRFA